MGWYDDRFKPSPTGLMSMCEVCDRPMWFPPSKAGKYRTCGDECTQQRLQRIRSAKPPKRTPAEPREWACGHCATQHVGGQQKKRFCGAGCWAAYREAKSEALERERTRNCQHCGATFVVKKSQIDAGVGLYCSQRCNFDSGRTGHLVGKDNLKIALEIRRLKIKNGEIKYAKGPDHHRWISDRDALMKRRAAEALEYRRRYRKANPHKMREFKARRKGRVIGRLPKGTVAKIGQLQKWRCVTCRVSIRSNYHVDHITPIARGGTHTPDNIQLLCPGCNVRKSAKDPIEFMQERGFLL
jgi:5-methylcytosine-specific restriction endonuclease McrA